MLILKPWGFHVSISRRISVMCVFMLIFARRQNCTLFCVHYSSCIGCKYAFSLPDHCVLFSSKHRLANAKHEAWTAYVLYSLVSLLYNIRGRANNLLQPLIWFNQTNKQTLSKTSVFMLLYTLVMLVNEIETELYVAQLWEYFHVSQIQYANVCTSIQL